MPPEACVQSTLLRIAAILGRPLSDFEVATVLATLRGWHDMARTLPAERVVEIIKAETAATAVH